MVHCDVKVFSNFCEKRSRQSCNETVDGQRVSSDGCGSTLLTYYMYMKSTDCEMTSPLVKSQRTTLKMIKRDDLLVLKRPQS